MILLGHSPEHYHKAQKVARPLIYNSLEPQKMPFLVIVQEIVYDVLWVLLCVGGYMDTALARSLNSKGQWRF